MPKLRKSVQDRANDSVRAGIKGTLLMEKGTDDYKELAQILNIDELTHASKEQYYALEDIKAQYQEACATYGETSAEALRLKEQVDEATVAFEESKQKAEDLAEEHKNVMDAYRDMASTYSENSSTIEQESSDVTSLVAKLESLTSVEKKTASTKEQILGVVDLLNEALPELSLSYDANTDSLNKSTDAVLALAKAESSRRQNESDYQELMDRLAQESDLERDLETQHKELTEAEKELAEAEKAQSDAQKQQNKAIPLTYTTKQGDMWDSIAYKVYGIVSCLDQLIDANPAWRSQYIFPAGVEVNTPALAKPITADDLPPWKKVAE